MAIKFVARGKVVLVGPDKFLVNVSDSGKGILEGGEAVYVVSNRLLQHIIKVFGNPNGLKVEIKISR